MRLFLDNAVNGRNTANDEFIAALRQRAREIRALADRRGDAVPNAEIERGSRRLTASPSPSADRRGGAGDSGGCPMNPRPQRGSCGGAGLWLGEVFAPESNNP